MARIPLGNQGDVVSAPAQQVQTSAAEFGGQSAQALEQLGTTATSVGQKLQTQQNQLDDDLQRTSAAVAYQQHSTNVQLAQKDATEKLNTGELDQVGYVAAVNDAKQQSFDSTIGALPDNHYKKVATIQSASVNRNVDLSTQAVLTKNTQQQIGANADTLLDTAGKNIALNPADIDATVDSTKSAYLSAAMSAGLPQQAASKKAQDWADQQYAQHAVTATIQARSSGDLDALGKLESDLTDPKGFYANKMDANQRNQVLSTVVSQRLQLENQQGAQQQARETQAATAYNGASDLLNQGKQFSPAYTKQLVAATSGTAVGPDTQQLITLAGQNAGFSSLSLPAMQAAIQKDQGAANTPGVGTDPLTAKAVKARQNIYDASVDAYKKDPWNAALDRGVITAIPQLDTSSIPNMLGSLQARAGAVGVIENQAGRRVSLLTPDEASQTLQMVNSLSGDAQAQVLQGIGAAYGSAPRINDLAEQWKEKSPPVALALKAGSGGGDGGPLLTDKGAPISTFILAGAQAVKDKTVKVDEAAGTGIKAQIATQINGTLPPNQAEDAKDSAYYIALGNAVKNGREQPSSSDIQSGIDTATGGISNTGGTKLSGKPQSVARPYGWTDDQFQASVKTATPANIENQVGGKPIDTVYANGKPIPAEQFMQKFPSYQLMRVGVRGTYAVVTGSKFVSDSTGAPVTIHLMRGQQPTSAQPSPQVSTGTVDNPF